MTGKKKDGDAPKSYALGVFLVYIATVRVRTTKTGNLLVDMLVKGYDKQLPIPPLQGDGMGQRSLTASEWDKLVVLLRNAGAKLAISADRQGSDAKTVKDLKDVLSTGRLWKDLLDKPMILKPAPGEELPLLKIGVDGSSVNYGRSKAFVKIHGKFTKFASTGARRERTEGLDW